MCSLRYMLVNTNSVRYSAFCVMTSQQRDTGNISSSDSLPDVAEHLSSPSGVKRPRLNETNENPAVVVDAMSPEDQQIVLLVMEQDDPTAGVDGAPDETAENATEGPPKGAPEDAPEGAPEDAPDANEDDGGDVDRSRSTDAANTSSAPIATNGTARKKKQAWVRSAFK